MALQGKLRITHVVRECDICGDDLGIVWSKCMKPLCGGKRKFVDREKIIDASVSGMGDLGNLMFLSKMEILCGCCYPEFGLRMYQHGTSVYHVFPNSYIPTEVACPFFENCSMKKCEEIKIEEFVADV